MMKKIILIISALLLMSGVAAAQNPQVGFMGLFIDEIHSVCEVNNPGGFYPFTLWIWCMPSINGQICAEFMIIYPPNVISSTVTQNDAIISVTLGDLGNGMSVCYTGCQWGWNWPFRQAMYLTDTAPSWIGIGPHPDIDPPIYQFANCDPGYPTEDINIMNQLALNQPCVVAVEETSWGAIKSLYR
jgi:hypothetical protein